jgi:hypothetical protein
MHKIEAERTLPNSYSKAEIFLRAKPYKSQRKKKIRPIFLMNIDAKNTEENTHKLNPRTYQRPQPS